MRTDYESDSIVLCYGATKDPNEGDYMLIFSCNVLNDLLETFGKITWKYKIDELINRLFGILNEINNKKGYQMTVSTTYLSNELFETLKILENCTSCKKYNIKENGYFDKSHKSMN